MMFRSRPLWRGLVCLALFLWPAMARADAPAICTLITDIDTGTTLLEQGDCDSRATPASTFKVPLALIGYAEGMLTGADTPVMRWREGDPDWGGAAWRRDTGPSEWMRHSVVWYSQRLAHDLGARRLTEHARALDYGNADFSGDPGQNNGLDRAWISSSLRISPREQARFMTRLVTGALPHGPDAIGKTLALLDPIMAGGWTVRGKTGSAYPRRADGRFDYARGWGWFVGWAERDGQRLGLVRLTQATQRSKTPRGIATRDGLLAELPALIDAAR